MSPIAAGRTGPDGEVRLTLAQDLAHCGVGLPFVVKPPKQMQSPLSTKFRDRVVQGVYFVINKPHYTNCFDVLPAALVSAALKEVCAVHQGPV